MNKLLKMNPADNVCIVCRHIFPGEKEDFDGHEIVFNAPFGLGEKIAVKNINVGEQVIKFGISIGTATQNITIGSHVHLHNLKSNYLPTYTLDHEFIKNK